MRKGALLLVLMAGVAGVGIQSAGATTPEPLSLNVSRLGSVWSASGAFADSGTFADSTFFVTDSSTVHGFRIFTGSGGTFTARFDARIVPTGVPGVLAVDGHWRVIAGTGSYHDLHGGGTIAETFTPGVPPFIIGTWDGSAHFD